MAIARADFDVFLSHNSQDKPSVRQLALALKDRGLRVWLDEWELRPGEVWQDALEEIVTICRSAVVCVAKNGLGKWEEPEIRALVRRFVNDKKHGSNRPIIPVLLPDAPPEVKLPIFLEDFTWCDLREGVTGAALERLVWGITGDRPPSWQANPAASAPEPVAVHEPPTPRTPGPASTPTPDAGRSLTPIRLRIVVCYLHPERRDKLVELRKACLALAPKIIADVAESGSVQDAVNRVHRQPETTILLLDGFEPGSRQLEDYLGPLHQPRPFRVLINDPEWNQSSAPGASASLFQQDLPRITSDQTLAPTLRKTLLRVGTEQLTEARLLASPEELESWFELRYRVWTEMNYLAPEKVCPQTPWELDYTDRTSLALGLFSKADGRLLGGARLVRGLGEDHLKQIQMIDGMLREKRAQVLIDNFRYPDAQTQPFDILGELDGFQHYYRQLVRSGVTKAEVSRVVVDKPFRHLGLGEVIVDTLMSVAHERGIQVLFLACHKKHATLYERNGFQVIDGVVGDKFLTYQVPCIAMERREKSSSPLPTHAAIV